ncbi:Mycothiol acetyltransferase [uncultured archaeon]|nr:Mycothiol acetyltransferase [uncultured archaeon]
MKIRPFELGDAKDIARLHTSEKGWFEEDYVSEEFVDAASRRLDFQFFVAIDLDGRFAGFVGALFYDSVGRAEVGPIAVEPYARGKGVGGELLESMVEFLRGKGIRRVAALVKAGNKEALRFFEYHGFHNEALLGSYTRRGEDVAQLVRFI